MLKEIHSIYGLIEKLLDKYLLYFLVASITTIIHTNGVDHYVVTAEFRIVFIYVDTTLSTLIYTSHKGFFLVYPTGIFHSEISVYYSSNMLVVFFEHSLVLAHCPYYGQ